MLFCHDFFLFFLIIHLYVLIPAVIATAELMMLIGITTKKAKAGIEAHPLTVETKISKCQYNLKSYKPSCASYLINSFSFISPMK